MSSRPSLQRPGARASFAPLLHLHGVRALLCWRYVRHRRVLPVGGRLVFHLLFLDQSRLISAGPGQGRGAAEPRAGGGHWDPSPRTGISFTAGATSPRLHLRPACCLQWGYSGVDCVPGSCVKHSGARVRGGRILSPTSPPAHQLMETCLCPRTPLPCSPCQRGAVPSPPLPFMAVRRPCRLCLPHLGSARQVRGSVSVSHLFPIDVASCYGDHGGFSHKPREEGAHAQGGSVYPGDEHTKAVCLLKPR